MKSNSVLLAFVLAAGFSAGASAQVISYSPRTGDISIDTQLGYMNDYGRQNRNYFVDDIVSNFGAPRYLVNELLTTRHFAPADAYYACALAYQLHRPCGEVAKAYEQDRGHGWGVVAQRLGIKPGSAQFHALKGQVGKSNGKYKQRGLVPAAAHTDHDDSPGHSGKAKGTSVGHDHDNGGKAKGASDAHGNSGKAKGKSKGH